MVINSSTHFLGPTGFNWISHLYKCITHVHKSLLNQDQISSHSHFIWFLLFTVFLCNLFLSSFTEDFSLLITVTLVLCPFSKSFSYFLTGLVYSSALFPQLPAFILMLVCSLTRLTIKTYSTDFIYSNVCILISVHIHQIFTRILLLPNIQRKVLS